MLIENDGLEFINIRKLRNEYNLKSEKIPIKKFWAKFFGELEYTFRTYLLCCSEEKEHYQNVRDLILRHIKILDEYVSNLKHEEVFSELETLLELEKLKQKAHAY